MDAPDRTPAPPVKALRILAALAFVAIFYTAASLWEPGHSTATPAQPVPSALDRAPQNTQRLIPSAEPAFVGSLLGVNYQLDIFLTPSGGRYTVRTASGDLLAELISQDQLYREFPDLDVDQMHADVPARAD